MVFASSVVDHRSVIMLQTEAVERDLDHRVCGISFGAPEPSCHLCPRPGRLPAGTPLNDASSAMVPIVGKKVRFYEPYRPPLVRRGTIGVIVDMEDRPTALGLLGARSLRRLHHPGSRVAIGAG